MRHCKDVAGPLTDPEPIVHPVTNPLNTWKRRGNKGVVSFLDMMAKASGCFFRLIHPVPDIEGSSRDPRRSVRNGVRNLTGDVVVKDKLNTKR